MLKGRNLDTAQPYHRRSLLLVCCFSICIQLGLIRELNAQTYLFSKAQVHFVSEAPLEIIKATNKEVSGAIDLAQKSFVVQIKNKGFQGFNSPLQQEHFFENYLEAHKYPKSVFKGKLIDAFDPTTMGNHEVRIKGILDIHGIQQERIVRVNIQVSPSGIGFSSTFLVQLADHQISIPRIVHQKIAEEIQVQVLGQLIVKQP